VYDGSIEYVENYLLLFYTSICVTGIPSLVYPPDSGSLSSVPGIPLHSHSEHGDEEIRQMSISVIVDLVKNHPKTRKLWDILSMDPEMNAHWDSAQFITVQKLGMNDHGRVHAMVATASSLRILDLLLNAGITPDMVSANMGDLDDAYLVVLTAALTHDIGNQIHRKDHISHSMMLVVPILDRILPQIYDDTARMIQVRALILSLIYSHHGDPRPLTIEAGAVCIGDATDMTTGRARSAYDQGRVTIHTISALSINQVSINQGDEVPVEITIRMSNYAGLFQVQEILAPKIAAGPITRYVEVKIQCADGSGWGEKEVLF